MNVNVEASGYFKKNLDELNFSIEIPEGKDIIFLIDLIKLPSEQIGFVVVNNKNENFDYVLSENDVVGIFPFIVGG